MKNDHGQELTPTGDNIYRVPVKVSTIRIIKAAHNTLHESLGRRPMIEEVRAELSDKIGKLTDHEIQTILETDYESPDASEDFEIRARSTLKNHELEKARAHRGMMQKDLARLTGIGQATLSQIESCRCFPTDEQQKTISDALGVSVADLFPEWLQMFTEKWNETPRERILPVSQLARISLSHPDVLALESPEGPEAIEKDAENNINKVMIAAALDQLSPKEKDIVMLRSGLKDGNIYNLEEVGKQYQVTRERIRQIEVKALERLRCVLERKMGMVRAPIDDQVETDY